MNNNSQRYPLWVTPQEADLIREALLHVGGRRFPAVFPRSPRAAYMAAITLAKQCYEIRGKRS